MNRKHKGIRFDENGNVVCEPNAEFGADVDVDGALTINSAKDLKTKDGSSFGDIIPTLEVTQNDDGTFFLTSTSLNIVKSRVGTHSPIGKVTINIGGVDVVCTFYENANINKGLGHQYICTPMPINLGLVTLWCLTTINLDTGEIEFFSLNNYSGFSIGDSSVILADETHANYYRTIYVNKINGNPIISGTESEDIKVQSTLYRHTIDIDAGGLGLHTFVTALSEKNTVIDSIQDLVAVFGNTKLMATGMFGTESESSSMLEVGTSSTDTYVHSGHGSKISLSNWANYGPDESRLIITDSVTAM